MRKLFVVLFAVVVLLCCVHFDAVREFKSYRIQSLGYDPGEILVKIIGVNPAAAQFAEGRLGIPAIDSITAEYGIRYIRLLKLDWYRLEFSEYTDVTPIIDRFSALKEVHYASKDAVVKLDPAELKQNDSWWQCPDDMEFILLGPSGDFGEWLPGYCSVYPNDPLFKDQWAHGAAQTNLGWHKHMGKLSTPPVVQILDQGIFFRHEDSGRFKADAGGYYGRNHCEGRDPNDPSNESPAESHATHVAGIVAAAINNGKGCCGVVPDVWMRSQRVINSRGYGTLEDLLNGIVTAADECILLNGSRENKTAINGIFNMSLGFSSQIPREMMKPLEDALDYARSKGCFIIAAAGNENEDKACWPAQFPDVLGVAATALGDDLDGSAASDQEQRAWFSNYGEGVDLCAPGHKIMSTVPDDGYEKYSGTSMAAPFVTGAAALVVSYYPQITMEQLREVLTKCGDAVESEPGHHIGLRVNVLKALEMAEKLEQQRQREVWLGFFNSPEGKDFLRQMLKGMFGENAIIDMPEKFE